MRGSGWLLLNLTLAVFSLLFQTTLARLPDALKSCPRSSDFESCLRVVLENAKPYLARGNFGPGLDTPRMEPIFEELLQIAGPELNINMTNLYTKGATTYRVTSVKPDFQKLQFDIGLLTPQLSYNSKYRLSQKFTGLNIDVKGDGDMNGIFNNVQSKMRFKFVIQNEGGKEYVKLKRIQFKMKIQDGKFRISSLSNTNDNSGASGGLFTEIANNFINSDPAFILRKVEPSLEKTFERILTDTTNVIFKDVAVSDFFSS